MYSIEMKISFPSHPNGLWRNVCYTQSTRKSLKLARMLKLAYPDLAFRVVDPLTGKATRITYEDAQRDEDVLVIVEGYSPDDDDDMEVKTTPTRKHAPRPKSPAADRTSRVASRITAQKSQKETTSRSKRQTPVETKATTARKPKSKDVEKPTSKSRQRYIAI